MKQILHKANDRGIQDHGWLKAAHSFSFGGYYNPAKVQFGLLRVLNDDIIAPGMGFGTHGHDNMEIVTIPLRGSLSHRDSLGSEGNIGAGEIQIMSAGTGIQHSEYNGSETEEVNLLQIWVFPKERNIQPRYEQKAFRIEAGDNHFTTVVSPEKSDESMWINQDAYFSLGKFDAGADAVYEVKKNGNGVYLFLIEGKAEVSGTELSRRDALGVYESGKIPVRFIEDSYILAIEVPLQ